MRALILAVVLPVVLTTTAHAGPTRYRLEAPPGLQRIDLAALPLPVALDRVRLTCDGQTVLLWHKGKTPGMLAQGDLLCFVAPTSPRRTTRHARLFLTLGAPATGSVYRALGTLDGPVQQPRTRLMIARKLERDLVRSDLIKAELTDPRTERWFWLRVPPGRAARLPVDLGTGPARLGMRLQADQAPSARAIVSVALGTDPAASPVGSIVCRGGAPATMHWAVVGKGPTELVLTNRGARPVYLDRLALLTSATLAARDGRFSVDVPPSRPALRVGGLEGDVLLAQPDAGHAGLARATVGALTLPAGLHASALHVATLARLAKARIRPTPAPPVDLRRGQADWLAICPAALQPALVPLVAHRRAEGLAVRVVDPQTIYDAFDAGHPGPKAIRAFLAAAAGWSRPPRYTVLVGDATGAVDWVRPGAPLVPTGMVRTHLNGATASDLWLADPDGDGRPSTSLGRLPAANAEQLGRMVRRIVALETTPGAGRWRREVALVAGPGRFSAGADQFLESLFARLVGSMVPDWVAVDVTYANPASPYCPSPSSFNGSVLARLNRGALVFGYVGHGFRKGFDSVHDGRKRHRVMTTRDLPRVDVAAGAPLAIVIACSTAEFDGCEPKEVASIGEGLMRRERGPVAFVGSTRISHPYPNGVLGKELLGSLFADDQDPRIGPLLDRARARMLGRARDLSRLVIEGGARWFVTDGPSLSLLRRQHADLYVLFGDPATRFVVPAARVRLEAPETAAPGATLALSGRSGLSDGSATIELAIRRDRMLGALPPIDPADRDASMKRRHAHANRKVAARWTATVAGGRFSADATLPADLPPGTYRLVAVVQDGRTIEVGARPLRVAGKR